MNREAERAAADDLLDAVQREHPNEHKLSVTFVHEPRRILEPWRHKSHDHEQAGVPAYFTSGREPIELDDLPPLTSGLRRLPHVLVLAVWAAVVAAVVAVLSGGARAW